MNRNSLILRLLFLLMSVSGLIAGEGTRVSQDAYEAALKIHKARTQKNDDFSQGVRVLEAGENEKAYRAFSKSWEAGYKLAGCGLLEFKDRLSDSEYIQAMRACADENIKPAQYALGRAYFRKLYGKSYDPRKAHELFQAASTASREAPAYVPAEFAMGVMYHQGYGGVQDYGKAFEYMKKSAEAGYKPAMKVLAYFYMYGYGVEKNTAQARYWREQAGLRSYGYLSDIFVLVQYEDSTAFFTYFAGAMSLVSMFTSGDNSGKVLGVFIMSLGGTAFMKGVSYFLPDYVPHEL